MAKKTVWSCEMPIEYGYYRIGDPDDEAISGLQTAPLSGGEAGVFVSVDPDVMSVRIELVLSEEPPGPRERDVVALRSTPQARAGITNWENNGGKPDSYDLIGPGLWKVWVHKYPAQGPGDAEDHEAFLYPVDAAARAWGSVAPQELAERRMAAEADAASRQLEYTEFLKPKAGVYFVVWDQDAFAAALADVDLGEALPDDLELLELSGGIAFRHRARAEIWVGAKPGPFERNGPQYLEKLVRELREGQEPRVLDSAWKPLGKVPDPAAKAPCLMKILRGDPDYAAWSGLMGGPKDEAQATAIGVHDWHIDFADSAPEELGSRLAADKADEL